MVNNELAVAVSHYPEEWTLPVGAGAGAERNGFTRWEVIRVYGWLGVGSVVSTCEVRRV